MLGVVGVRPSRVMESTRNYSVIEKHSEKLKAEAVVEASSRPPSEDGAALQPCVGSKREEIHLMHARAIDIILRKKLFNTPRLCQP